MTDSPLDMNDRFISLSPAEGTTSLAFDFELRGEPDLTVARIRDGVEAVLEMDADYAFDDIGDAGGGTILLAQASQAGDVFLLIGLERIERLSDFQAAQKFATSKINGDLDALTRIAQEARRDIGRAWMSPYGSSGGQIAPLAEGHFWAADVDGNMVDGGSAGDIVEAQAYAEAATAGAAAAQASAGAAAASAQTAAEAAALIGNPVNGVEIVKTGDYTIQQSDAMKTIIANKATAITFTLPAAAAAGAGFQFRAFNIGAGTLTVQSTGGETVNNGTDADLEQYQGATFWTDGTAWRADRGGATGAAGALTAASLSALQAIAFMSGQVIELTAAGRAGTFLDDSSDWSGTIAPSSVTTTAVDASTETATATAHGLKTGQAVMPTSSVNGLAAGSLCYVIRASANTFKLASSRANAFAGTAINLTGTTNFTVKKILDDLQGLHVIPAGKAVDGSQGVRRRLFDGDNYDPRWFGAACDAATDDWPAFFTMLSLMGSGDTMRLPVGLCGMSRTLEIAKAVSIRGQSKNASGFYAMGFGSDASILDWQGTTGARIQNIVLDNFCLRSDNGLARGMTLTWVNLSEFRNLYFYNLRRGAYGDNAWSNAWIGYSAYSIATETIRLGDECNQSTFTGCQSTGASGIMVTGHNWALSFTNCDFENITDTAGAGIYLAPTTGKHVAGVSVTGGYWETIKGAAIYCTGDDADSVRSIVVKGATLSGGYVSKFGSAAGTAQHGIILTNVAGFEFSGNYFDDWGADCFYRNSTEKNGRVSHNIYHSTAALVSGGSFGGTVENVGNLSV